MGALWDPSGWNRYSEALRMPNKGDLCGGTCTQRGEVSSGVHKIGFVNTSLPNCIVYKGSIHQNPMHIQSDKENVDDYHDDVPMSLNCTT